MIPLDDLEQITATAAENKQVSRIRIFGQNLLGFTLHQNGPAQPIVIAAAGKPQRRDPDLITLAADAKRWMMSQRAQMWSGFEMCGSGCRFAVRLKAMGYHLPYQSGPLSVGSADLVAVDVSMMKVCFDQQCS
ncbi:MAG: hypothetical protein ABJ327_11885 [Litoreibacter sp.]